MTGNARPRSRLPRLAFHLGKERGTSFALDFHFISEKNSPTLSLSLLGLRFKQRGGVRRQSVGLHRATRKRGGAAGAAPPGKADSKLGFRPEVRIRSLLVLSSGGSRWIELDLRSEPTPEGRCGCLLLNACASNAEVEEENVWFACV